MKKYEFTGETDQYLGRTLKQIRRLSDGLIGGWIEKESNLSHSGSSWIYGDAKAYDNAIVSDNARVFDRACVFYDATVSGNARVFDNVAVFDKSTVSGNACVYNRATVSDNACVSGNAIVSGKSRVSGNAEVTCKVFNLNYYKYIITMTDYHVKIGFNQMLAYEWLYLGIEDAVKMGFNREEYPKLKELLEVMIPQHFEKVLNDL